MCHSANINKILIKLLENINIISIKKSVHHLKYRRNRTFKTLTPQSFVFTIKHGFLDVYMNLKDTIFLPETSFSMRGNLSVREPEILEYWNTIDVYSKSRAIRRGCEKFLLHDGPPFANGKPHAGHALNKCIKDVILRFKRMCRFDIDYVPGWDCHGLPIEWKIEEKLKEKSKKRADIPVAEFRSMCQEFAQKWIDVQKEGFKRLGICADWENPYLTMNPKSEATVIRQIGKFILNGTLYRGEKPVLWSVVEKTALADAEVDYIDKKSTSIYVSFRVKNASQDFLKDAYCVIWTTTPWTIPANRAISYSKDITYCLLQAGSKKIVVAKELVNDFAKAAAIEVTELEEFSGELLQGTICEHPFVGKGYEFDVPLLHGDHVEVSAGTGLVHTAPGHGLDDFNVCKANGIHVPKTVDESGIYYDCVPLFAGQHIFKVEPIVLEHLEEANALLAKSTIEHSYPHSWRSKAPLIFRTTPQWFISMDNTGLRKKALEEIEKISWIPKQGYNRIKSFVENRGDWCVSRQRVWGVPIPLFINKKTDEFLKDADVIERIAKIFEEEGSNAWFTRPAQDFLGDKYNAEDFIQNFDTLDVWFESSSTYAYVLRADGSKTQADLYVEGSDQHRGWFQHSLLNACGTFGDSPFKSVLTHGFTVDEHGRKMSKSIGNTVDLEDIIKQYGADIFRMWVVCSDFTQDLKIGKNILKQLEDVYRKLRNTLRYMMGALSGYDMDVENVAYDELPDLEKWVLHRISEIHDELMDSMNNYDLSRYFNTIYNFCASDLSSFYFDIRKDCLYCDAKNNPKRIAYRMILSTLFHYIIRWLAPIMVYTTEDAWLCRYGEGSSVHLSEFLIPVKEWRNDDLAKAIEDVKAVRHSINTALEIARKDKLIGSSLQAKVSLYAPDEMLYTKDEEFWSEVAITSKLEICNGECPANAFVSDDLPQVKVVVSLASGNKCERCWKVCSLNENGVCDRCQDVLNQTF